MGQARNWTREEYEYLQDKWGTVSLGHIAKTLNRSETGVQLKVARLGLGAFLMNGDYITFNQLLIALGMTGGTDYMMKSWVQNRGFPIKYKKVNNNSFKVVFLKDFWKWAEKNKNFLDFVKFEENSLGEEPQWAKEKRKHDFMKNSKYINTPWTVVEDRKLEKLLKDYKYTYTDLSKLLRRTNGAIQRRICDIGLKERPLRESPHSVWEEWQLNLLEELINNGVSYEYMSDKIGKSAKAIRGKVYTLFGSENLDKARVKRKEVMNAQKNKAT